MHAKADVAQARLQVRMVHVSGHLGSVPLGIDPDFDIVAVVDVLAGVVGPVKVDLKVIVGQVGVGGVNVLTGVVLAVEVNFAVVVAKVVGAVCQTNAALAAGHAAAHEHAVHAVGKDAVAVVIYPQPVAAAPEPVIVVVHVVPKDVVREGKGGLATAGGVFTARAIGGVAVTVHQCDLEQFAGLAAGHGTAHEHTVAGAKDAVAIVVNPQSVALVPIAIGVGVPVVDLVVGLEPGVAVNAGQVFVTPAIGGVAIAVNQPGPAVVEIVPVIDLVAVERANVLADVPLAVAVFVVVGKVVGWRQAVAVEFAANVAVVEDPGADEHEISASVVDAVAVHVEPQGVARRPGIADPAGGFPVDIVGGGEPAAKDLYVQRAADGVGKGLKANCLLRAGDGVGDAIVNPHRFGVHDEIVVHKDGVGGVGNVDVSEYLARAGIERVVDDALHGASELALAIHQVNVLAVIILVVVVDLGVIVGDGGLAGQRIHPGAGAEHGCTNDDGVTYIIVVIAVVEPVGVARVGLATAVGVLVADVVGGVELFLLDEFGRVGTAGTGRVGAVAVYESAGKDAVNDDGIGERVRGGRGILLDYYAAGISVQWLCMPHRHWRGQCGGTGKARCVGRAWCSPGYAHQQNG